MFRSMAIFGNVESCHIVAFVFSIFEPTLSLLPYTSLCLKSIKQLSFGCVNPLSVLPFFFSAL